MEKVSVHVADFATGLFAALALRKVKTLNPERFRQAIIYSFPVIESEAKKRGLDFRFRVRPHPLHGTSATANEMFSWMLCFSGFVTLDCPTGDVLRIHYDAQTAEEVLKRNSGGKDFYEYAAKIVEGAYDSPNFLEETARVVC